NVRPIVQPIDEWTRNWRLALLFEARVGEGRLMVCTSDLESNLEKRLAARQFRASLLAYLASDAFEPAAEISAAQLQSLCWDAQGMTTQVVADGRTAAAIDSNPNTAWTSGFPSRGRRGEDVQILHGYPHELTLQFNEPVTFAMVQLMNRQNARAREGDICDFEIEVSDDGRQWRVVKRGRLKSTWNPQTVSLDESATAKYVRLRALSGYGPSEGAALAEFAVIPLGVR
ncbi:MAG: discoidin domain-containing protein, partial [Planctomycetales bacterium]|nr:discoidin domain-containing protein [Planctomycetales bacterium]